MSGSFDNQDSKMWGEATHRPLSDADLRRWRVAYTRIGGRPRRTSLFKCWGLIMLTILLLVFILLLVTQHLRAASSKVTAREEAELFYEPAVDTSETQAEDNRDPALTESLKDDSDDSRSSPNPEPDTVHTPPEITTHYNPHFTDTSNDANKPIETDNSSPSTSQQSDDATPHNDSQSPHIDDTTVNTPDEPDATSPNEGKDLHSGNSTEHDSVGGETRDGASDTATDNNAEPPSTGNEDEVYEEGEDEPEEPRELASPPSDEDYVAIEKEHEGEGEQEEETVFLGSGEDPDWFVARMPRRFNRKKQPVFQPDQCVIVYRSENSSYDISNLRASLRLLDIFFNRRFGYPIVVFHEGFTAETMAMLRSEAQGASDMVFVEVDAINVPQFIRDEHAVAEWVYNTKRTNRWGLGYRTMQRFMEGMFWWHPAILAFQWALRLDTDSFLLAPLEKDPFRLMWARDHYYGYMQLQHEADWIVEGFWNVSMEYARAMGLKKPQWLHFIADRVANDESLDTYDYDYDWTTQWSYNRIKFYSNFEIMRLDFFRSKEFSSYFDWIDRSGLIWTHRLGAPIRTVGSVFYLLERDFHWFQNVPYKHQSFLTAPAKELSEIEKQKINALVKDIRVIFG